MRNFPARCCRHFVQPVILVENLVAESGKTRLPLSDLVPLAQMCSQSLFDMPSYLGKCLATVLEMEVTQPATNRGIDLLHNIFNRHHRPISFRQTGNPVFDVLQGFL